MQVLTAVRKDIVREVIIENRTNLASHPYCMVSDLKKPYKEPGKMPRKIRILNFYDNKLRKEYPWQGTSKQVRRAVEDIR